MHQIHVKLRTIHQLVLLNKIMHYMHALPGYKHTLCSANRSAVMHVYDLCVPYGKVGNEKWKQTRKVKTDIETVHVQNQPTCVPPHTTWAEKLLDQSSLSELASNQAIDSVLVRGKDLQGILAWSACAGSQTDPMINPSSILLVPLYIFVTVGYSCHSISCVKTHRLTFCI